MAAFNVSDEAFFKYCPFIEWKKKNLLIEVQLYTFFCPYEKIEIHSHVQSVFIQMIFLL